VGEGRGRGGGGGGWGYRHWLDQPSRPYIQGACRYHILYLGLCAILSTSILKIISCCSAMLCSCFELVPYSVLLTLRNFTVLNYSSKKYICRRYL
jgi:hypothetical protein